MDAKRFDTLAKTLSNPVTRRAALRGIGVGGFAATVLGSVGRRRATAQDATPAATGQPGFLFVQTFEGGTAITDRIIGALGLAGTSYPTTPELPNPHAHGYATDPNGTDLRDVTRSNPDVAGPAGAMISTLTDLRSWAKALADGTLLSSETQRERLRWSPFPAAAGVDFGYGLGVMGLNGFVGHNGSIFGYSTWMMHLPAADATIVVLTNRAETQTETAGGIFLDIAQRLFPDRFPSPAGTPAAATPAP